MSQKLKDMIVPKLLTMFMKKERMCDSITGEDGCEKCPLSKFYKCAEATEESISIVQNWSDTYPEIKGKERPVLTINDAHILVAL